MSIKPVILLSVQTFWISTSLPAEVILDGTLGTHGSLPGPEYQISADLGQQRGSNLFHSFRDFNLQSHESATFSGPDSVKNVISRVTGGNPSTIDGTLRSTIPEANLYFLNPAGIMFGKQAQLDVQGSFHASTADVLRLGNEGNFSARQPENSILSVASPSAFGFLTHSPATITTQDSLLSVPSGKTLSLIGGDIHLEGSFPNFKFSFNPYEARPESAESIVVKVAQVSSLAADSGHVTLASVASPGEVTPTASGLQVSANTQGGHILVNNTLIETSGQPGGSIVIHGGHLELINSGIVSKNYGLEKGEQITIHADNLTLLQGAVIATGTLWQGEGGDISLKVTDALTISGISEGETPHSSGIYSSTEGMEPQAGKAGKVQIEARRLTLTDGSQIGSGTFSSGDGSAISIRVTDTLTIAGKHIQGDKEYRSGIYASSEGKPADTSELPVDPSLPPDQPPPETLPTDSNDSDTPPPPSDSSSEIPSAEMLPEDSAGSDATLSPSDSSPRDPVGEQIEPPPSDESTVTPGVETVSNPGNAGSIYIEAGQIVLKHGAISTDTAGSGKGGDITIGRAQQMTLTEGAHITSGTRGTGSGGTLNISVAGPLTLSDSRIYGDSLSQEAGAGNAGEIRIQANQIQLIHRGKINTSSQNAAGGNLTLTVPHLLYLQDGDITTSVKGGEGRGGDLTIQAPTFVILNPGTLKAQADAGRGGDIQIHSRQFLHSPRSVVSASSRLGIDGKIVISAPAEQISKSLLVVSVPFKDLSELLKPLCSINMKEETRSSFLVFRLAGSSPWPDDLQPSRAMKVTFGKSAKLHGQGSKTTLSSASAVIGCQRNQ